jgi:spermidine/putrescine transport system ATP-binding protein
MGTSNLMAGVYTSDGRVTLNGGPSVTVGHRDELDNGAAVDVSIRPEKIWLSEFEPGMVTSPGTVRDTVYSGPTTTYLIDLAPGVSVAVLEQNTDRSRNEERWANGQSVQVGWRPEHCLVLA